MRLNVIITFFGLLAFVLVSESCQKFKDHKKARIALKEKKRERKENLTEVQDSTVVADMNTETKGDSLFLYYEKTPCFGRCPIFKMTIYESGFATYDGINFVDNIGFHKATISNEKMGKIKDLLNAIGYFDLDDAYDNEHIMDIPARIIEARYSGKQKRILARYNVPEKLRDTMNELDKLFENTEWVPYSSN